MHLFDFDAFNESLRLITHPPVRHRAPSETQGRLRPSRRHLGSCVPRHQPRYWRTHAYRPTAAPVCARGPLPTLGRPGTAAEIDGARTAAHRAPVGRIPAVRGVQAGAFGEATTEKTLSRQFVVVEPFQNWDDNAYLLLVDAEDRAYVYPFSSDGRVVTDSSSQVELRPAKWKNQHPNRSVPIRQLLFPFPSLPSGSIIIGDAASGPNDVIESYACGRSDEGWRLEEFQIPYDLYTLPSLFPPLPWPWKCADTFAQGGDSYIVLGSETRSWMTQLRVLTYAHGKFGTVRQSFVAEPLLGSALVAMKTVRGHGANHLIVCASNSEAHVFGIGSDARIRSPTR